MGTYHWVTTNHSEFGTLPSHNAGPLTLIGPVGGILKRFQVRHSSLLARATGIDYSAIAPYSWTHTWTFNETGSPTKTIFDSEVACPMEVTSFYSVSRVQEVTSAWYSGGDREFGVNQKCSYGKSTSPFSPLVNYTAGLFGGAGFGGGSVDAGGQWGFVAAALFYVV